MDDYGGYLRSEWWKQRRASYLRRYPFCAECGETRWLQVHHLSYDHLGNEPDWELKTLCGVHHTRSHA